MNYCNIHIKVRKLKKKGCYKGKYVKEKFPPFYLRGNDKVSEIKAEMKQAKGKSIYAI